MKGMIRIDMLHKWLSSRLDEEKKKLMSYVKEVDVFNGGDPMLALKQREVYHNIKDDSVNLERKVEIFHRIVVRRV